MHNFLFPFSTSNSERLCFVLAGGLCDGKRGPSACVPAARHLLDLHSAAGHSAHALRLPAGLCQGEQGQHRLPVLAQLVCADSQGKRETLWMAVFVKCVFTRTSPVVGLLVVLKDVIGLKLAEFASEKQ